MGRSTLTCFGVWCSFLDVGGLLRFAVVQAAAVMAGLIGKASGRPRLALGWSDWKNSSGLRLLVLSKLKQEDGC